MNGHLCRPAREILCLNCHQGVGIGGTDDPAPPCPDAMPRIGLPDGFRHPSAVRQQILSARDFDPQHIPDPQLAPNDSSGVQVIRYHKKRRLIASLAAPPRGSPDWVRTVANVAGRVSPDECAMRRCRRVDPLTHRGGLDDGNAPLFAATFGVRTSPERWGSHQLLQALRSGTIGRAYTPARTSRPSNCGLLGSSLEPIRNLSTPTAASRPSQIAHTISDWPRRVSPAAKTPGTLVM